MSKFRVLMTIAVMLGFALQGVAGPGDGINVGELVIRPYADGFYLYNSNVGLTDTDEESDSGWGLGYGIALDYATERFGVEADFWGLSERYQDFDALDHDDFGNQLGVDFTTEGGLRVGFQQAFASIEDIDYSSGTIQDLDELTVGGEIYVPFTDKTDAELAYDYTSKNFGSDSFSDWDQHRLKFTLGQGVTDKSRAYASGTVGFQSADDFDDDGLYYNGIVGLRSQQTDKLEVKAGLGVVGLESDTSEFTTLGFEVECVWQATEKISVGIAGDRVIEPSSISVNNFQTRTKGLAEVLFAICDTLDLSGAVAYENIVLDRDFIAGGVPVEKEEDITTVVGRIEYTTPATFLKVFAEAQLAMQDSSLDGGDFDRQRYRTGLRLQY